MYIPTYVYEYHHISMLDSIDSRITLNGYLARYILRGWRTMRTQ